MVNTIAKGDKGPVETEEGYRIMVETMESYKKGSLAYAKWKPKKTRLKSRPLPVALEYRFNSILLATKGLPMSEARPVHRELKKIRRGYFPRENKGWGDPATEGLLSLRLAALESRVRPRAPMPSPLLADEPTTLATWEEENVCIVSKGPREVHIRHKRLGYWEIVGPCCLTGPSPHPTLGVSCCGLLPFHGPPANGGDPKERNAALYVLQKMATYLALNPMEVAFLVGELDHASDPWSKAKEQQPASISETLLNSIIPTGSGWV